MKICLINNLYEPYNRGGAEQVVKNIVQGFENAGQKVFIITSQPWLNKKIAQDEFKVYRFFTFNFISYYNLSKIPQFLRIFWHLIDIFNLYSFYKIRQILKKEKPDLIITHNLKGIGYLIPFAIKSLKIRHIHMLHDVQLAVPSGLLVSGRERSWQNNKIYEKINQWLFSSVEIVISPSKWLMDFYAQKGFFRDAKKIVLPNPILMSNREFLPARDNKQDFIFLFIGQIEEEKGIFDLVSAFNRLKEEAKLVIVGDGKKMEKLKNLTNKNCNIKYLGKLSHKEVINILIKADILVIPSICYDNSPTVIYEAFSYKKPVLGADIGGIPELVGENRGFLFKAGYSEDLAAKMLLAIFQKEKLPEMGEKGYEFVKQFGVEAYLAKLLQTLDSN